MEPRVIKAKWDNYCSENDNCQVYVLTAGPAPRALHACKESREEAKRKYCFVKSHLPFTDRIKYEHKPWAKNSIWINFDIDTLYFVNFPPTIDFLSYMRRLSKKRIGGADNNIKYIAFQASLLHRLGYPRPGLPNRLPFFYRLVSDHLSIEKIIIMLDNSKFEDEKHPQNYSLSRPSIIGKNSKGGGRWGSKEVRQEMRLLFAKFFTEPKGEGLEIDSFKKFKDKNPDWVLPTFTMLSITKTPKHGYAGDGLPLNQRLKKRVAPSKPTMVVPNQTTTSAAKGQ